MTYWSELSPQFAGLLKCRRGIHPKDTRQFFAIVDVGVGPLGSKVEAIAYAQLIFMLVDGQLNFAIKHIAKFLTFMPDHAFASAPWFDVIDVTGEQIASPTRNERLQLAAPPSSNLVGSDRRTFTLPEHDVRVVAVFLEQSGHRHVERKRHAVHHLDRRICVAIFNS